MIKVFKTLHRLSIACSIKRGVNCKIFSCEVEETAVGYIVRGGLAPDISMFRINERIPKKKVGMVDKIVSDDAGGGIHRHIMFTNDMFTKKQAMDLVMENVNATIKRWVKEAGELEAVWLRDTHILETSPK